MDNVRKLDTSRRPSPLWSPAPGCPTNWRLAAKDGQVLPFAASASTTLLASDVEVYDLSDGCYWRWLFRLPEEDDCLYVGGDGRDVQWGSWGFFPWARSVVPASVPPEVRAAAVKAWRDRRARAG